MKLGTMACWGDFCDTSAFVDGCLCASVFLSTDMALQGKTQNYNVWKGKC